MECLYVCNNPVVMECSRPFLFYIYLIQPIPSIPNVYQNPVSQAWSPSPDKRDNFVTMISFSHHCHLDLFIYGEVLGDIYIYESPNTTNSFPSSLQHIPPSFLQPLVQL